MADKPLTMLENAIKYAEYGWKVYPLIQGGKVPHKGSNGHLDASNDPEEVKKLFLKYGSNSNIGINLLKTEYIVIDIDRHQEGKSGFDAIQELEDAYQPLPDTFTVTTPRNGEHRYFKISGLSLDRDLIDFRPGVDVLGTKVNAVPSQTETGAYRVKSGNIAEIAECPRWFMEVMAQHDKQKRNGSRMAHNYSRPPTGKKFTAVFLEELLNGQTEGNRNAWITKQYGRMVSIGMDFTAAYEWIQIINERFVQPPLSAKEINVIVMSIAKREQQKYERLKERS